MTIEVDYSPYYDYFEEDFTITLKDSQGTNVVFDGSVDFDPDDVAGTFNIEIDVAPDACGAVITIDWTGIDYAQTEIVVQSIDVEGY